MRKAAGVGVAILLVIAVAVSVNIMFSAYPSAISWVSLPDLGTVLVVLIPTAGIVLWICGDKGF